MNHDDLEPLVRSWEAVRDDHPSRDSAHDDVVGSVAARLAADPGGGSAYIWTFGLVVTAPHLAWLPGPGLLDRAVEALNATDAALRERPCAHDSHPYEEHEDESDEELAELILELADETTEWERDAPREEWLCPRNVAGFARIALDIVEPGSVTDVPPRLPASATEEMQTLSAMLHGYPKPWTDINEEINLQASALESAEDEDLTGRVMVVRAVGWYAISGMVRDKSVVDGLVEALEGSRGRLADAVCDHDWHPRLPKDAPGAAELGILVSSRGGRGCYECDQRESGEGAPLERVVCPVFARELAEESLEQVRGRREELFGERETAHLDAEYLLDGGRLDVEKIAERLDHKSWNEQYADDLGLWAARRHAHSTDERERAALLVTAYQALSNAYPSPVLAACKGVLSVMRPLTAAGTEECAHEDAHPQLRYTNFRKGLPHLVAPDLHPADPEESRSLESWTCPRFHAEVAEACVKELDGLYEDESENEDDAA